MKPNVLVTRMLPQAALDLLAETCTLDLNEPDEPLGKREIMARLPGKQGMVCLLTDPVDDEVLAAGPELRCVSNVAVGYDNIDVNAATRRQVMVTNTPGVLTETTADFIWALLMASARRVVEADKYTRAGKFTEWRLMLLLGNDLFGKTLGIVGLGRIGRSVAKRAKGFDMKLLYHNRTRLDDFVEEVLGLEYVDLDTLLGASDYVVLTVPLLPETTHLISTREFGLMKKTAYLINAARGPVVDENALVAALEAGEIAGAGLDVYEEEPRVHPGLMPMDNVILAPHIASASVDTRTKMAMMAAENMTTALRGELPPNLVNIALRQQVSLRF